MEIIDRRWDRRWTMANWQQFECYACDRTRYGPVGFPVDVESLLSDIVSAETMTACVKCLLNHQQLYLL